MTMTATTWEHTLRSMAEPNEQDIAWYSHPGSHSPAALQAAYDHCRKLTNEHSRSFYLASALLSAEKREAVRALYAFCRTTDDIVDNPKSQVTLSQWRKRSLSATPDADDLIAIAWADARTRYNIPQRYAEQLIDGVARDLHQNRYDTFEELATYCYAVASTVGLMSMHIIGFESDAAIPYAIKLGVALQLTNILRDVAEDWQRGRLYLPQEELEFFGLSERDIHHGRVHRKWRTFMRFQISRTRRMYAEAWPGIAMLNPDGRFAIAAAAGFYRAILEEIESADYDNFSQRAIVSQWGKISLLPNLWWRSRR